MRTLILIAAVSAGCAGMTASRRAGATPTAPVLPGEQWSPLRPFLGRFVGEGDGEPGRSTVAREYRAILGGRYLHGTHRSTYAPQAKNPKGEIHEHWDVFSWDRRRKAFVLRQFHGEGFVNQYVLETVADDGRTLVFTSEAIENIAPGWRARETYRFTSASELIETFELAAPGAGFTVYSENRLRRAAGP
jgi:hypothetical protein